MHISTEDRKAVIEWAQNYPEILEVWLFGSFARGTPSPKSDIDLAVVTVGATAAERDVWIIWPSASFLRTPMTHMRILLR